MRELGEALGFSQPVKSISKIFERNKNELKHYSVVVKLTTTDGKAYDCRAFTREGALIVSMLARTNKAKAVRAWLARLGDTVLAEAEQKGYLTACRENAQELLAARPLWRNIKKYREKGLSGREIGLLLNRSESNIHRHIRSMTAAHILPPPPDIERKRRQAAKNFAGAAANRNQSLFNQEV